MNKITNANGKPAIMEAVILALNMSWSPFQFPITQPIKETKNYVDYGRGIYKRPTLLSPAF
jgi:hypothetical protein